MVTVGVVEGFKVGLNVKVIVGTFVSVGVARVGLSEGVCCTSWVNASKVAATLVATGSDGDTLGVAPLGILQALKQTINTLMITIIVHGFFIGFPATHISLCPLQLILS